MTDLSAPPLSEEEVAAFAVKLTTWTGSLTERERLILSAALVGAGAPVAPDHDVAGHGPFTTLGSIGAPHGAGAWRLSRRSGL